MEVVMDRLIKGEKGVEQDEFLPDLPMEMPISQRFGNKKVNTKMTITQGMIREPRIILSNMTGERDSMLTWRSRINKRYKGGFRGTLNLSMLSIPPGVENMNLGIVIVVNRSTQYVNTLLNDVFERDRMAEASNSRSRFISYPNTKDILYSMMIPVPNFVGEVTRDIRFKRLGYLEEGQGFTCMMRFITEEEEEMVRDVGFMRVGLYGFVY